MRRKEPDPPRGGASAPARLLMLDTLLAPSDVAVYFTVTTIVPLTVVSAHAEAVIVAVPALRAVTTPSSTAATAGSPEVQFVTPR